MRTIKQKFLSGLACMLFLSVSSSAQYEQGDTIEVIADRYFPTKIEAEWFDPDSSRKVVENSGFISATPLTLPELGTLGDITYVKSGPSSMLLYYHINVGAQGGTFQIVYNHKKVADLGNIRYWIDGGYYGGTNSSSQSKLPDGLTEDFYDYPVSKEIILTPGYHAFGILMNRSNSHWVDNFTLVPVPGKLNELGAKATLNTSTTNPGMVKMTPDYDTSYVVGDVVEFTAVPEANYYFHNWEGDTVSTENPITLTLDTTNNVKAVFYRTPDTLLLASERYTPVIFEAEATTKIWHRDHPVDSLTEIGILSNNVRSIREGREVISNIQHGGKMFFPIKVGGNGGKYRLSYEYYRINTGGNRPGNYLFLDDAPLHDGNVLETIGAAETFGTSNSSLVFELTPGNHVITLKPNGGSNIFELDKIILTPDSLTAVDAQLDLTTTIGGSVAKTPDYGTHYVVGDALTLTATPDFGFLFGSWSGDVTSTDNPLNLTVDSAMNIVANFIDDPDISNYTVVVTPKDSGMVSISPEFEDFATGSDITIEATPKFGYYFSGWSGDTVSTVNPLMIDSITKNYAIDANFMALPTYTLTIQDEYNLTTRSLELDAYPEGAKVVLTADQNRTHRFAYWNEDMALTDKMLEVTITSDTTIKVNYETKSTHISGDYVYIDADAYVTDTIQAEWYNLDGSDWNYTGDLELIIDTISGTDTVIVTKTGNGKGMDYTLMVGNEGGEYVLDYYYRRNVLGDNNVKVFLDGKQISSDYAEIAVPETAIGVWAKATSKHNLKLTPGKHTLRLQFHYSDRNDVDFFTLTPVPGTIDVDGTLFITADETKGSVTRSVEKVVYDKGEEVILTAVPDSGFAFIGWSGDHVGMENPLTVKMDSTVRLTATFVPAFKVTINAASVNGQVSIDPVKAVYPVGDTVRFTPVPDTGYKFDGWFADGGIGGDSIPLTLVVNRDIDLTAYFSILSYRLIVTAENGSIGKAPNRISYSAGTEVVLTPTPSAGYVFDSWSGDASGSDNPLTIKMDSTIEITAIFKTDDTALDENSSISFKVYPNPSKGMFTVDIAKKANYEVYSLAGVMVKQGNVTGSFNLDMSEFTKGMYVLRIETQDGVAVKRIILE